MARVQDRKEIELERLDIYQHAREARRPHKGGGLFQRTPVVEVDADFTESKENKTVRFPHDKVELHHPVLIQDENFDEYDLYDWDDEYE